MSVSVRAQLPSTCLLSHGTGLSVANSACPKFLEYTKRQLGTLSRLNQGLKVALVGQSIPQASDRSSVSRELGRDTAGPGVALPPAPRLGGAGRSPWFSQPTACEYRMESRYRASDEVLAVERLTVMPATIVVKASHLRTSKAPQQHVVSPFALDSP